MKTKIFLLSFIVTFSFNFAFSQQKVALHHNGVTTIFGGANPFLDAYNASVNGDTLYLPGGTIPYPTTINKGLVIIGAGHYPDSTTATGKTVLPGSITISQYSDHLWLEGIDINGDINFSNNHKVDSMVIRRCKFNTINFVGDGTSPGLNNSIRENVITGSMYFTNAFSAMVENNICNGQVQNALNTGISNNVFLYNGSYYYGVFYNVDNCYITNNVVFKSYGPVYSSSELNTFSNNIFSVIPPTGTNTFVNNYNSVDVTTLFVNQSGNAFDYSHNYHLNSPGTYLGIDGSQVGIYGGINPFKEGSVPFNPHIQIINNATTTNANGDLQIQIQVEAQNQ